MKWHLFELVVLILAALVLPGAASGQQTTSATPQSPTAPYFTYAAGPNGCSNNNGFIYPDPATCIVPGEKPPGSFALSAVGGSYADPNFGATVTILSNPNCFHEYSTPSAVSAHNKYVLTSCGVIELATVKLAFPYQPANFNEGSFWDALDDNVFYFISGSKIMKRNLQGGVTVLVDYSTDGHNFSYITMGGTGDTSNDNWIAFYAPKEHNLCAADLTNLRTYCADYNLSAGNLPYKYVDFPMMAKGIDSQSHKRYVLLAACPAMGVFSVNTVQNRLDFEYRGPENNEESAGNRNGVCDPGEQPNTDCLANPHMDTYQDSNGLQYIVYNDQIDPPCAFETGMYRLNAGPAILTAGRTIVMKLFGCGEMGPAYWTEDHVACAKHSPYCVISTNYSRNYVDPASTQPLLRGPHESELIVVRDGLEIRRIAQHRSVLFTTDGITDRSFHYWHTPRASISPDGQFVIADSNFGVPSADNTSIRVIAVSVKNSPPSDTVPPAVNITAPVNGATVSGSVQVQGAATDNVGATNIQFYVDGTLRGSTTASPFSFTSDTASYSNGVHTFTIKGYDAANNVGASAVTVNVSNSAPPAPGFTAIRVNAGGPAYTDPQGHLWSADIGYVGGASYSNAAGIAGTSTPALYQSEHYSTAAFQYQFSIPNGNYTVNLKFAEIYWTTGGHRIFNVALNGQTVLPNFDPAQVGGAFTAVDRSFPVSVTNGQMVIQLTPVADVPTISAIEIQPQQTGFTPIRVNAGGSAYTDPQGNTWSADAGFNTGFSYSDPRPIASTNTPTLYQAEHYSTGPFQYQVSVPNGNYRVNLKFAEIYWTSGGHRIFNVAINGQTVLPNFDPAQVGGAFTAVDRSFQVSVANGQVVIQLTPVADVPTISAIEILPAQTAFTPIRVNAGGSAYTDPQGNTWSADTGFNTGFSYSDPRSIAGTNTPALYQTEHYSTGPFQYQFSVPNGNYTVNLKFAEIYWTAGGHRIFNVAIDGQTVLPNFDPAQVGGAFTAVDRQFAVPVTNGQIVIQLTPIADVPTICAIEIFQ